MSHPRTTGPAPLHRAQDPERIWSSRPIFTAQCSGDVFVVLVPTTDRPRDEVQFAIRWFPENEKPSYSSPVAIVDMCIEDVESLIETLQQRLDDARDVVPDDPKRGRVMAFSEGGSLS